jgi:hypothetical protein
MTEPNDELLCCRALDEGASEQHAYVAQRRRLAWQPALRVHVEGVGPRGWRRYDCGETLPTNHSDDRPKTRLGHLIN